MKIAKEFLILGLFPLLASCASQSISLPPVGPGPVATGVASTNLGYLCVFSEREPVTEGVGWGANPTFYQHSDYSIYNGIGKLVKRVNNTIGHYETGPRLVPLLPGTYAVKARGKDFLSVNVPVAIEPAQITNVHLDDRWEPVPGTPKNQLVTTPSGSPVGWRATPKKTFCDP
jgi:hypothetical protein